MRSAILFTFIGAVVSLVAGAAVESPAAIETRQDLCDGQCGDGECLIINGIPTCS
jgi:hypothetical protein